MTDKTRTKRWYFRYGKRLFDLLLAIPALILLAPMMACVALLIKIDSPGPVFFRQERVGKSARGFHILKFRTMIDRERIPDGEIISANPEVTRVGFWLRRFKIDELPQLLNVVKGDMSIVGPRPGLPAQLTDYTETAYQRLEVKPGITGLAQVNGNIYLSWEERWIYDAQYVDNCSLLLDLEIIFHTIAVVILGEAKFLNPLKHL